MNEAEQLVRCPGCRMRMKVSARNDVVALRCPNCGERFSVKVLSAGRPPSAVKSNRQVSRLPLVIVVSCTVAVIAGVVLIWYMVNYPRVERRNQYGELIESQRVMDSEVEGIRQSAAESLSKAPTTVPAQ